MKPLLRWAGSKRQLLGELKEFLPNSFERYVEPFAGSACLFFDIGPDNALLGDINCELIDTYVAIQRNWRKVAQALKSIPLGRESYYDLRRIPMGNFSLEERAARLIFLNRFCFNGLFRTNSKGQFNVPYGGDKTGRLPSKGDLERASELLSHATLVSGSFEKTLMLTRKGDFVYMDPPYAKRKERSFTEYSPVGFGVRELSLLRRWMHRLKAQEIDFLVTYSEGPEAAVLSEGFRCSLVQTRRCISGFVGSRGRVWDVIIYP